MGPRRGFDAVLAGEFEPAFCGDQLIQLAPIFETHGVAVWLPELGSPVDVSDPMHLSLLKLLGVHAKREVQRARLWVKAAMQFQVTEQGRTIGGRPPYGHMIVDAGPHPNRAHARWGRRLHRYTPAENGCAKCGGATFVKRDQKPSFNVVGRHTIPIVLYPGTLWIIS